MNSRNPYSLFSHAWDDAWDSTQSTHNINCAIAYCF